MKGRQLKDGIIDVSCPALRRNTLLTYTALAHSSLVATTTNPLPAGQ